MKKISHFETIEGSMHIEEPVKGRFSLTYYNETFDVVLHDDAGKDIVLNLDKLLV